METVYFELMPANKECADSFIAISQNKYNNVDIFENACKYVNESSSFKRSGKTLEIVEIGEHHLKVKLNSESRLDMPAKSLSGFSRELIRLDEQINPDESKRFFKNFIYNRTLFRNIQVNGEDWINIVQVEESASDIDALKICVDLFAGSISSAPGDAKMREQVKREIKKLLYNYSSWKRTSMYAEEMMKRMR